MAKSNVICKKLELLLYFLVKHIHVKENTSMLVLNENTPRKMWSI